MVTSNLSVARAPHRPAPPRQPPVPGPPAAGRAARVTVRLVLVAGALAVAGLWWANASASSLTSAGGTVTAVGRVTGLLGAYAVLVQVLLMARLPWFEHAVGLDRLTAWHRAIGTNVVLLLVAHVLLIVEGYSLTYHQATAAEAWTVLTTYPDMLKAVAGMALFLAVAVSSGVAVRRHVSYETWYVIHLGAYVAIGLAFFHQIHTGVDFVGNDARHVAARAFWTIGYLAVAAAVLWWRVGHPVRHWLRHRMVVDKVVTEADGVVSVWIRGRDLDGLEAQAGQFLLWRFCARGHLLTAHPYSLSIRPTPTLLRVTIKDAGDHSRAVAHLRRGTPVLAEGPFGHFRASTRTRRRVLLVAGGSGIGPIRALAEELTETRLPAGQLRRDRDVVVVYRASRRDDLALKSEFDAAARSGRLTVRYVIGDRHRFTADPLGAVAFMTAIPDIADREVFICGPLGFTARVRRSLDQLGVRRALIHTEEFSLR